MPLPRVLTVETDTDPTFFATPAAFRRWLARHHASRAFVWIGFWKKASGNKGITYAEAVDEALCFGWIDGLVHSFDDRAYKQRFTPRKAGSIWSAINIAKAERLKKAGRMEKGGLAAFEGRDPKRAGLYSFENKPAEFSPAVEKRFRANKAAWRFFAAQPPGYRRVATFWVMSAKQEATRERRLARLIEDSGAGNRLASLSTSPRPPRKPRSSPRVRQSPQ
jgi:uncharacterized protein YdeI (YjbR/CyaY-like superfamily)